MARRTRGDGDHKGTGPLTHLTNKRHRVRLGPEAWRDLGIICSMEDARPQAWIEARILQHGKRYRVQVLARHAQGGDGDVGPAGQGGLE